MPTQERANRFATAPTALLFAALLFFAAGLAAAAETFSIHGFGTLGAVRTDGDDVEFVRDLSQARGTGDEERAAERNGDREPRFAASQRLHHDREGR